MSGTSIEGDRSRERPKHVSDQINLKVMITAVQKHSYIEEDIDFYFSYAKSID